MLPQAMTDADDVNDLLQNLLNSTESDVANLSHLDAPNDSLYMIFGVIIAMVLVALIIILLAITISKLRKREDSTTVTAATPNDVVLHAPPPPPPPTGEVNNGFTGLWQYPPPQFTLYSNDKETLVQPGISERPKFARGIRKNLSGRWKRLTKKKAANEVYTIPADLRDQLKSIYVY